MLHLLALFMALQAADIFTTRRVLKGGGYEANPIMAWAMDRLSFWPAMVLKFLIAGGLAYVIYRTGATWFAALMCTGMAWVVWHNWKNV